jgi:hypothetical protein
MCALALAWSSPGWSQGRIHMGKLSVTPGLKYDVEYNDNVFLDVDDEKDDWVHTITPSLFLNWNEGGDTFASLGYQAGIVRYNDYSDQDYEDHSLIGEAGYNAPSGLYLRLRDTFQDTEDPYGSENDYRLGESIKRWNNDAEFVAGYELADLYKLELSYRNAILEYDAFQDQWQNRMSHEPGIALYYKFLPKTSVFVQYQYEMTEYPEQDDLDDNDRGIDSDTAQDYDYHKGFIGLEWDATAKLNGQLKVGYGYKDYDNKYSFRTDDQGRPIEYDEESSWIAGTDLTYQWRPKTALGFSLERENLDSPSTSSNSYDRTRAGFGITQALGQRMTLSADAAYTLREYDEINRDDDQWELGLDFRYAMLEWLSAGLRYEYDDRESDDPEYEYTNNIVGLYLQATY